MLKRLVFAVVFAGCSSGNTPLGTNSAVILGNPETSFVATPSDPSLPNVTFTMTSSVASASFQCSLDRAPFASCLSSVALSGLSLGQHVFAARALDNDGGMDPTPAEFAWTVKEAPPVAPLPETMLTKTPAPTSGPNVEFQFSSSDAAASFSCRLAPIEAEASPCVTPKIYSGLADRSDYVFEVRAKNSAGVVDSTPATFAFAVAASVVVCTPANTTCVGSTLHACRSDQTAFDDTFCDLGCVAAPTAHCGAIVPTAPLSAIDYDATGLADVAIVANVTLSSDTGAISGGVRAAAASGSEGTRAINNGIAFHTVTIPGGGGAKLGVFSFKSLVVGDVKTLLLTGTNPVALVAAGDISIIGVLDARGKCTNTVGQTGPGGGRGATLANVVEGPGGGASGTTAASDAITGGAGGSFGDVGGRGGSGGLQGPQSSALYGAISLLPFQGGSGGGRGGNGLPTTDRGGNGGDGGGAVWLAAGSKIIIGKGTLVGGVNAGGCGGSAGIGMNVSKHDSGAGGGGGSGGAILLQAPNVEIGTNGMLAANGGGGGAGTHTLATCTAVAPCATGSSGEAGRLLAVSASGGANVTSPNQGCGAGGLGGAVNNGAATTKGKGGGASANSPGACSGGAGGGAGRIRIETRAGAATITGGLSPRAVDLNSLTPVAEALATEATLVVQ